MPHTRCAPLPLVGRGWGWGSMLVNAPRATITTPTPLATLATLPTRGRVGARCPREPNWRRCPPTFEAFVGARPAAAASVSRLTFGRTDAVYGAGVIERSVTVVSPLPPPSWAFPPSTWPRWPRRRGHFCERSRPIRRMGFAALNPSYQARALQKKSAPARAGARMFGWVSERRPVAKVHQSRRLGASGTFFQCVRLSAMILVDCRAA